MNAMLWSENIRLARESMPSLLPVKGRARNVISGQSSLSLPGVAQAHFQIKLGSLGLWPNLLITFAFLVIIVIAN